MATAKTVAGKIRVALDLNATEATSLLSLLNQFFIPTAANSGLADVRASLRALTGVAAASSRKTAIKISANRGTKKYAIG